MKKDLDIEFLLDKSGSMGISKDTPSGKSRWDFAQETTHALAAHCEKFDADGITVVPFATTHKVHDNVTADKVGQVFAEHSPNGSTNTAGVLRDRIEAHFRRREAGSTKATLLFVMTDGEPDDRKAVADVIVAATQRMGADEELAIQFIQVGQDAGAAAFLKSLDDDLVAAGAKFDIVDTINIAEVENFSVEALIEKSFAN